VSCIDRRVLAGLAGMSLVAGCSGPPAPRAPSVPAAPATPEAAVTPRPGQTTTADAASATSAVRLPPPNVSRNWTEVRLQAARRLVAANPGATYTGPVPEPLLAIPVLEIELNGDGTVRKIEVLRHPRQAKDTVQLASDAVRRAAPYGDVSRLPKPWRFTETFLFDDERKFKPRTLDQ
jgi:hypothetical protein